MLFLLQSPFTQTIHRFPVLPRGRFPVFRSFPIERVILIVCKQCYPNCKSTGLKPVMNCKIPCIYIAETHRSSMIRSTYSNLLSHERQDSSVRFRVHVVQLEYLGRYMHQTLVLYFKVNYFLFHVLQ
jgi:hypothetical protein